MNKSKKYQTEGNYVEFPYSGPSFDFTGLRNFRPLPEPMTQEQQNKFNWDNLNPQPVPVMPQPEPEPLSNKYNWMNFDGQQKTPPNPNAIKTYDISAQTGYNPQNALNNGQVPITPAADKNAVPIEKKKPKIDPYFALRGTTTALTWLSERAERNRQDQYMYNQYSTLGQIDPANIKDYQPTPYNQYFQPGGYIEIKRPVDNNNSYTRIPNLPPPVVLTEEQKRELIRQEALKRQGTMKEITKEEFNKDKKDTRSPWSDSRAKERGDKLWNGAKKVTALAQYIPIAPIRYGAMALNSAMGAVDSYNSFQAGDTKNGTMNAIGAIPLFPSSNLFKLGTSLNAAGQAVDAYGTVLDLTDNFGEEKQEGGVVNANPYKEYYSEYMKSPKYRAMLGDNPEVAAGRNSQLDKFPAIKVVPNTFFGSGPKLKNGFIVGEWNKESNTVNVNERLNPARIPGVVSHEVSHQTDNGGQFIPQKDIDFMTKLRKPGLESNDEINYLSQPTEIRARLNQLRYKSKERNVYDPFTQEFKSEYLDKFKNAAEMQDLRKLYSDEQIVELMNSVSQAGDEDMTYAQQGGTIYTSNPNDPRLRAYQDSLTAYNNNPVLSQRWKKDLEDYITLMEGTDNPELIKQGINSIKYKEITNKDEKLDYPLQNNYALNKQVPAWSTSFKDKGKIHPTAIGRWYVENLPIRKGAHINNPGDRYGSSEFPVYKKPVQPVVYKKDEPQLKRMPVTPMELLRPESLIGSGRINPVAQVVPEQENQYRVEYTDPETGERTHRDFANEKQGSDFQKLIGGDREGYWLGFHKKGGWIKDAVNPEHKGYCTPMTKSTCTPRRKALARTFKKHHGFHQEGGTFKTYNL